ncbi:MAG: CDP-diacylglycerol--glycerol-3-phosphate 3-phosphatidyltransferase [Asticcacaulis sp.]
MTGENVNPIPNILTMIRLLLGVIMFLLLAGAAGGIPFFSNYLQPDDIFRMQRWAFYAFVLASSTDFLDGWLARKLNAVSAWGAILDPIADKILVCGTILGLFAFNIADPVMGLPCALILFREFAVSALREAAADKGFKVPVSLLAKIKTTIQLVALGALLLAGSWSAFNFPPQYYSPVLALSYVLILVAAFASLWTGAAYFIAARKSF